MHWKLKELRTRNYFPLPYLSFLIIHLYSVQSNQRREPDGFIKRQVPGMSEGLGIIYLSLSLFLSLSLYIYIYIHIYIFGGRYGILGDFVYPGFWMALTMIAYLERTGTSSILIDLSFGYLTSKALEWRSRIWYYFLGSFIVMGYCTMVGAEWFCSTSGRGMVSAVLLWCCCWWGRAQSAYQ